MAGAGGCVLFLGPADSPLLIWLRGQEPEVRQTTEEIDREFVDANAIGFLVSYGYRRILEPGVLDRLPGRAVNLHISLLPWNRGADPNLWSFVENTPKGVTIHYIDEGVDTGDIIAQREVEFDDIETQTLATTYARLDAEIQSLFRQQWESIKSGTCDRRPQAGAGSYHRSADRDRVSAHLTLGWDTPVSKLAAAET